MEKLVKEKQGKQLKEKKTLSKKAKIWISLGTAFVFVASVIAVVLALVLSPRVLNLHGLRVANFESYAGIGVASFGKNETASAVAYAADGVDEKKDMNLAGITKDNKCQKIEFENENGKITKQNARLIHFDAYDKFSFFTLTTNKKHEFVEAVNESGFYMNYSFFNEGFYLTSNSNSVYFHKDTSFLILDNITGKIYDMREVWKAVCEILGDNRVSMDLFSFTAAWNMVDGGKKYEPIGQKSFLIRVARGNLGHIIFQAVLTENGIEVSQRINSVQFENIFENMGLDSSSGEVYYGLNSLMQQDIFGNIFVRNWNYPYEFFKYQKVDGTFVDFMGGTMGINSVMYLGGSKYINAEGEVETAEMDVQIISNTTKFHRQEGNVIYAGDNKITLDEECPWKYSVEKLVCPEDACLQGNFAYKLDILTSKITKYDLRTNVSSEIDSVYEFKNLEYNKYLDRVSFKAIDKTTYFEVDGYFDALGNIHIGDFGSLNYGKNRVYIIKPIN